ncbi:MAG: alpha/beta hydrolase [Chloroflexi bacterium]|nr:alpha/beta hydrolase [Chloroflexota bacterium]MDA1001931.1 alpha/beta hydrolase [Chloroflexota bacterium]
MAELIPGRVTIDEGVPFGTGGGRRLHADVFTPPGGASAGAPGVVIVHGGGWREGDRSQLRSYGIQLARRGFVAAAIEYRLLAEAPWPAQIHDVKAAIRWMRANAPSLGIDPERTP